MLTSQGLYQLSCLLGLQLIFITPPPISFFSPSSPTLVFLLVPGVELGASNLLSMGVATELYHQPTIPLFLEALLGYPCETSQIRVLHPSTVTDSRMVKTSPELWEGYVHFKVSVGRDGKRGTTGSDIWVPGPRHAWSQLPASASQRHWIAYFWALVLSALRSSVCNVQRESWLMKASDPQIRDRRKCYDPAWCEEGNTSSVLLMPGGDKGSHCYYKGRRNCRVGQIRTRRCWHSQEYGRASQPLKSGR